MEMVMGVDVMDMRRETEIRTELESQRDLFIYDNEGNKKACHFGVRNF